MLHVCTTQGFTRYLPILRISFFDLMLNLLNIAAVDLVNSPIRSTHEVSIPSHSMRRLTHMQEHEEIQANSPGSEQQSHLHTANVCSAGRYRFSEEVLSKRHH